MKQQSSLGISVESLANSVGRKIRSTRKSQKMTLLELAKTSGVAVATISRIETGRMTGTLECHLRLAHALGIRFADLYAEIDDAQIRGKTVAQSSSTQTEVYVHKARKSTVTLLTSDVLRKKLLPVLVTLAPKGSTQREQAKAGTERFIYVLEGQVEAKVGEQEYRLRRGSTLYLDALQPHFLKNTGRSVAKCLSVVAGSSQ